MRRFTWKQVPAGKPLTPIQREKNRLRGEARRLRGMGWTQEDVAAHLRCGLSLVQEAESLLSHETKNK